LLEPSRASFSGQATHVSLLKEFRQISYLLLLSYQPMHHFDHLGVVHSLIGQRNSIAVVLLCHVPELRADTSFLDLSDIEAAEAVVFVADAGNCLDSGKVVHEIFVDGVIEYFGESTRGVRDDDFRDLVASW
jgi:hypothetical protein